jgi:hypothetical protein
MKSYNQFINEGKMPKPHETFDSITLKGVEFEDIEWGKNDDGSRYAETASKKVKGKWVDATYDDLEAIGRYYDGY